MGIKQTLLPWLAALGGLQASIAWAATPVPVLTVGSAPAAASLTLDGLVQARQQATLSAQVGGNVTRLLVKAGARVRAGQAVATLDDRDAAAALSRTEAGVAQAEAELRNARLNAERQRDLRAKGFVSQAALDVAETQLKAAQAAVQQAQGGRSQAALARDFAQVSAPFDGIVLATHLEAGDLASPGRAIATVYAPGALRAVVQVPASRAALARGATRRSVRLPDGSWVTPQAATELPGTDPVAQTVEWRLDLPTGTPLQPGQALAVRFEGAGAAPHDAARLVLPTAAVLRRGELEAVYLQRGERFVLQAVRTGTAAAGQVDVVAGLKSGDRVAADAVRAGLADAVPAR